MRGSVGRAGGRAGRSHVVARAVGVAAQLELLAPAALAAITLAFTVGGCSHRVDADPAAGPKPVTCAPVVAETVWDEIDVRGTVAPLPDRDAQVAPQIAGRLLRVLVREGDVVSAGQALARIDDAPMLDAANQADAALARAVALHKNAQTTRARAERVFAQGIAPRQEVEDAAAKEAAANADQAEATAAARVAHRQIDRALVKSPLGGVVLKVLKRAGELVDGTPATPVVEVADLSRLELVGDVPAADLVRIAPAAHAVITFSALGARSFAGAVSRVAPAVDRATGVGLVRVAIEDAPLPHPPVGVLGVARIRAGDARAGVVVPASAVRGGAGPGADAEVVVCGSDGHAHVRKVQAGSTRAGRTEIRGAVAPPERVAVDSVLGLADGDAVEAKP